MAQSVAGSSIGPEALLAAQRNVNSQNGEDGIIAAILSHFPERSKWCVEFGAWDGRHLSNTRRLIDEEGCSAVLIEASRKTFARLAKDFAGNERVHCINAFVGFNKDDGLDTLLARTPCPRSFDVLSIDIDGNDIHVWRAVEAYRPKLVVIEFNPTVPLALAFAQPAAPEIKWGSGLRAMFELGLEKGYRLVCANAINAFFVAEEHWPHQHARSADELARFQEGGREPVYVFAGYDGSVILSQDLVLPWHRGRLRTQDVQVIPGLLRRYPDDHNWAQKLAYRVFKKVQKIRYSR